MVTQNRVAAESKVAHHRTMVQEAMTEEAKRRDMVAHSSPVVPRMLAALRMTRGR